MKSILEKALVHLLNEEAEKAQELMHQFVVERAKEIHESLREGDDADMDNLDDTLEEEFFTEADLEDAEAADNLEDDLDDTSVADEDIHHEDEGMKPEGDMVDGEADADMAVDGDADGEVADDADMADKIDAIEDEIAALQAEFDKIMAEFENDSDDDSSEDMAGTEEAGADDMDDEEDFDSVTESMVDDLKKISTPNEEGRGATGEKLGHPEFKSPVPKDAKAGGLALKNTVGHTGFDRETPPAKKDGPDRGRKYTNIRSKATDGNSGIPASGPKGAELAKPVAGNTKSVIPGRKK